MRVGATGRPRLGFAGAYRGARAAPTGGCVGQLLRAAMTTLEGDLADQNVEPTRGSGPAVYARSVGRD